VKKLLFLLLVVLCANRVLPQSIPSGASGVFSEIHSLPYDNGTIVYFSYRIPYNFLVFEKTDNGAYKAGFTLNVEASDSLAKNIKRAGDDKDIVLEEFAKTNSVKDYVQGVVQIVLNSKETYTISPYFTDKSSFQDFKVRPQKVVYKSPPYCSPIVIEEAPTVCEQASKILLANYNGDIPFEEKSFNLILPVKDTSIKFLDVMVENNGDTVFTGRLSESFLAGIQLTECDKKVIIDFDKKNETRNFVLKNVTASIHEGPVTICILDTAKRIISSFRLNSVWNNKPFALMNYEYAIKALKFIESDNVIDSLLSYASEKYQRVLFDYWKKYEKPGKTKFNKLMTEYYQRVDYSAMNFRTIGNKNGIETDRGKIYIKYGAPSKTERTSSEKGKIIEIWLYKSNGLKFSFVDKTGNGDFTLMK